MSSKRAFTPGHTPVAGEWPNNIRILLDHLSSPKEEINKFLGVSRDRSACESLEK
jgi:hypothetical protein